MANNEKIDNLLKQLESKPPTYNEIMIKVSYFLFNQKSNWHSLTTIADSIELDQELVRGALKQAVRRGAVLETITVDLRKYRYHKTVFNKLKFSRSSITNYIEQRKTQPSFDAIAKKLKLTTESELNQLKGLLFDMEKERSIKSRQLRKSKLYSLNK